ncbi:uncharacterized protein K452DRAFT_318879 [Aplosporella prunicola CBS 121167]|uniref:Uncharacterized protein n=1 Tax=Aplosporella prunicola CBS 121167 TaxID=1176127 RepID=A0A6A6BD43_9PEZI|nr:uncharacterized protein K452DRAFT_318879 [Aplosporella prunicola CBS 121167]KAF2141215.1 hypothetical protein K452DRAFT_318879 [Aplosporella prunicola CBS 121167]
MYFDIKSIFLLGLVAAATASPVAYPGDEDGSVSLHARMAKPQKVKCPDGTVFEVEEVTAGNGHFREAAKKAFEPSYKLKYPDYFGNKSGGKQVIPTASQNDLYEWPIFKDKSNWTNGKQPGKYRTVHSEKPVYEKDKNGHPTNKIVSRNWTFVGIMQHVGGPSNAYEVCNAA